MLKVVAFLGNAFESRHPTEIRKVLRRQILPAQISTNTAINKSLRRSQYDTKRPERRRTGLLRSPTQDSAPVRRPRAGVPNFGKRMSALDALRDKRQGPNQQQRFNVKDVRESASINEVQKPQRRLRKPLRRNEKGEFDRSTRGARYNYDSKPEGNRALRRALKFGHQVESAKLSPSNTASRRAAKPNGIFGDKVHSSEKGLSENAPSHHTPRRAATLEQGGEQEHGLAMPEELLDDIELSTEQHMPRFSIRRHMARSDPTSYVNRPGAEDYVAPSRASGRALENYERHSYQNDDEQSPHRDSNVPLSMPYTTPASEFLYGTSVITAALLSSRRKLYKLYIYAGDNREAPQQDHRIRELALKRGVVVERVKEDGLRLMSKMSAGRPHNGYILEASPLPKLPVAGFLAVEKWNGAFHVILDHQSREEEAVNGTDTNIEYEVGFPRYPFVLLLDGILDPGNLGAILRTAFFLGVDTVAISNRNSAPLSPVAIKASTGASEALSLVSVSQPGNFIDRCKGNGWKIYAAAAPSPGKRTGLGNYLSSSNLGDPIRNHPCILILGGEGDGLHWNIRRKADFDVGIDGPRIGRSNVDSLNVSVAAGLLCEAFLRKPAKRGKVDVNAAFDVDTWTGNPNDGTIQMDNRVF